MLFKAGEDWLVPGPPPPQPMISSDAKPSDEAVRSVIMKPREERDPERSKPAAPEAALVLADESRIDSFLNHFATPITEL